MSGLSSQPPRPPYRLAAAVAAVVLAGYMLTLAPTVTFWDAGELIAAARTLGIPHPPGTPLFVLLAHVWALLVPLGEYAARTNLLSAAASAAGAGFLVLVAHESTRRLAVGLGPGPERLVRLGGAIAAGVAGAFTFTQWQNSNETEVYAVATLTIAAVAWLALRWRDVRAQDAAPRLLLLIVYLFGASVGNHLLALLAGPAVVAALAAALLERPAQQDEVDRVEWAQVATVAGVWALLLGIGLGSQVLGGVGLAAFTLSHLLAWRAGRGAVAFNLLALLLALAGVSAYLFLLLRARQYPVLNEAEPTTWRALLDVIARAQYPARTPLDDPTIPHGAGNPGRSLTVMWLQLQNYLQYFDWQWARSIERTVGRFPLRTLVTLLFASLGLRGVFAQRRVDRTGWWLCLTLFVVTGLGLVAYMNFRPGYSLGWDLFPRAEDHEVRERDYFFVVSFVIWGFWAGVGLAELARERLERSPGAGRRLALATLALALLPAALNARAADRRHGPDARLAADWAYDLLNTVPPNGILFTYGDNDTFPLWWAQQVAGIRQDVTVICLALANSDWYMRQLRALPVRPFDAAGAPAIWRDSAAALPSPPALPLHTMTDAEIRTAAPERLGQARAVRIGPIESAYPVGSILYPSDILALRVMQQNIARRPIVWSVTTGGPPASITGYVVQQGLGYRLLPRQPDASSPAFEPPRVGPLPLDVPTTVRLATDVYRYGALGDANRPAELEPTSADIAHTLALPWVQLAAAYAARGDTARARDAAARASGLSADRDLRELLGTLDPPHIK
ncbi:MAG TPA: DUF2723 domain-containing protein [Gemmatimonadales bacterium]|nr:DUF2723 domain-containing protein [Gemmatimonadales bacterium]